MGEGVDALSVSALAPSIVLDVIMTSLLVIGGLIGWFRGALKATVILAAFILPVLIYLHFSDVIADYTQVIIDLATTAETNSIGILGTFSGLMGGAALFGSFFLASRLILFLLARHEPSVKEKIGGVFVGLMSNQLMALLFFMLVYTAMPASIAQTLSPSIWWKASAPMAKAVYPTYQALILQRTERLREAIASDGLLQGLAAGRIDIDPELQEELTDLVEEGTGQAIDLSEQFFRDLNSIDVDAISDTISNLDNASPEDIDRLIKSEDQRRRNFLDQQLQQPDQ